MQAPSNQESNNLFPVVAKRPPVAPPVNYLFLGNPGTGKSTLINCLAGTAIVKSGLSYGGGLTKDFSRHIHDNVQYMDTPGLADRNIQEKAAAAITEALRQSGTYKLLFMVRLENGRVVSDDLATIEIVLSSIEMDDIPFAVIVNNVKKRQYTELMKKDVDYMKVVTVINSIKHTTPHLTFIPVIADLDEEDNAVTKLPDTVEKFIRSEAPTVQIPPHIVSPIKIEDFKKLSEKLRGAQNQLLNDNALLERRVAELMGKSHSFQGIFSKVSDFLSSVTDCLLPTNVQQRHHGTVDYRGGGNVQQRQDGTVDYRGGGNSIINTEVNSVQTMAGHHSMSNYPCGTTPASGGSSTQHPAMDAAATPSAGICNPHSLAGLSSAGAKTKNTAAPMKRIVGDTETQRQNKHRVVESGHTNQQTQATGIVFEDSTVVSKRIQHYEQQASVLKNDATALMINSGVTLHDNAAKTPAIEELLAGHPTGETLSKPEGHLDEDGDEKMAFCTP